MDQKWIKSEPKMDPKMDQKWTKSEPKMDQQWIPNGPRGMRQPPCVQTKISVGDSKNPQEVSRFFWDFLDICFKRLKTHYGSRSKWTWPNLSPKWLAAKCPEGWSENATWSVEKIRYGRNSNRSWCIFQSADGGALWIKNWTAIDPQLDHDWSKIWTKAGARSTTAPSYQHHATPPHHHTEPPRHHVITPPAHLRFGPRPCSIARVMLVVCLFTFWARGRLGVSRSVERSVAAMCKVKSATPRWQ